MPPTTRIPPLLQPYTSGLQQDQLVLLTGILGASTNWLLIRYLSGALAPAPADDARRRNGEELDAAGADGELDTAVILVSWMRDWEFWKTESRRAGGLDLARLAQQNRFCFIDGLSALFLPPDDEAAPPQSPAPISTPLPLRQTRTITPRGPPPPAQPQQARPAAKPAAPTQQPFRLTTPTLAHLEETIQRAHASLNSTTAKNTILVLDQPDVLLAATEASGQAKPPVAPVTAAALADTLLHLRGSTHATVLTLAADAPLVSAAAGLDSGAVAGNAGTPLETECAAFLTGQAHVADWVLGCRLLDTGFAADVSGVLRITKGGGGDEGDGRAEEEGRGEKEVLYYVGGDGGVNVFERGSGGGHE